MGLLPHHVRDCCAPDAVGSEPTVTRDGMVGLATGLLFQRGIMQDASRESGAEQGLTRPYGIPHGFLEGRVGNPTVLHHPAKSGRIWGIAQPPWALRNGSSPLRRFGHGL